MKYNKLTGISAEDFLLFSQSPQHYNHFKGTDCYPVEKDFLLGVNDESRDYRSILGNNEYNILLESAISLQKHELASKFLQNGIRKVSRQFRINNIICKAQADYVIKDQFLVYLDLVDNSSPEQYWDYFYSSLKYRYVAFQNMAFNCHICIVIAMEKFKPNVISVYSIPNEVLRFANSEIEASIKYMNQCIGENYFPGYIDNVTPMDIPEYILENIEELEKLEDEDLH